MPALGQRSGQKSRTRPEIHDRTPGTSEDGEPIDQRLGIGRARPIGLRQPLEDARLGAGGTRGGGTSPLDRLSQRAWTLRWS